MDNIEIQIYDEINDYKEKIYFLNFRQWVFAILIVGIVVPTYMVLKDKIGEEITSYIIIGIAGILGFLGFIKIHELPAERILPCWVRHYFFFNKSVRYITDKELEMQQEKKNKHFKNKNKKIEKDKNITKKDKKTDKQKAKKNKKELKKQKQLEKAKKRFGYSEENIKRENNTKEKMDATDMLSEKISKLSPEQQEVLLKLLER